MPCARKTWLALDDFQNIGSAVPEVIWSEFLRQRAKKLHLLILSRHFLGEQGGHGEKIEEKSDVGWLDYTDFALTEDEARGFFAACGLRLGADEVKAAHAVTKRCVMGLRLQVFRYVETGMFADLDERPGGLIREIIWDRFAASASSRGSGLAFSAMQKSGGATSRRQA